jgi:hypothetical protein
LLGRFTMQDIVIGVRVKRWIETDQIDAGVGEFFPIGKPFQVVAKIETVHWGQYREISPLRSK